MFTIRYQPNIPDHELSQITLADFEGEYGNVLYGQFEINVNGKTYGLYDPDAPTPILEFFEEEIIASFGLLNEVVISMQHHKYIALNTIDAHFAWFEFIAEGEDLTVYHVQVEEDNISSFIVTEPLNCISICYWQETITKQEFIDEVLDKTDEFIRHIEKVNPALLRSKSIQGLLERCGKSKLLR
ncbi:hypothetical protein LOK74_22635 [Brevibacillus humidisoli]|uniref:hypothetical protein n=1 Tax=Brevibacillus humidisoli TaxID=2895522 RepID=UPI001E3E201B|nr:hypothetical protein [Brevibacillus humidisoli]UFJ40755.1 hypothetical protein LOK74_22635 [Brevibacillus humidisoli]